MTTTVTVFLNGEVHKIGLTKTGPTTLFAEHKKWNIGSNTNGPADSDDSFDLTQCSASPDGSILVAKGPEVLLKQPDVRVEFRATPTGVDTAELAISGILFGNSDQTGRISPSDYAAGIAFVKQCGFPNA